MTTITRQIVLIACGILLLAGCSTAPQIQSNTSKRQVWEYKTDFMYGVLEPEQTLDDWGKDGWILSAVIVMRAEPNSGRLDEYHYVLRRLKN
jgi:hypothetical protein